MVMMSFICSVANTNDRPIIYNHTIILCDSLGDRYHIAYRIRNKSFVPSYPRNKPPRINAVAHAHAHVARLLRDRINRIACVSKHAGESRIASTAMVKRVHVVENNNIPLITH